MALTAHQLRTLLVLQPHPEEADFTETFRDASVTLTNSNLPPHFSNRADRPISSAIYFVIGSGSVCRLHRIPSSETWHFYMGEPLTIFEVDPQGGFKQTVLGPDLVAGQVLQYTVLPFVWFGCYPTKDIESFSDDGSLLVKAPPRDGEVHYSFVGCTYAPAFEYEDFELANISELLSVNSIPKPFIDYLLEDDTDCGVQ